MGMGTTAGLWARLSRWLRMAKDTPWGGVPGRSYTDTPTCEMCWHGHGKGQVCVECLRGGIYCDREKYFLIEGPGAVQVGPEGPTR